MLILDESNLLSISIGYLDSTWWYYAVNVYFCANQTLKWVLLATQMEDYLYARLAFRIPPINWWWRQHSFHLYMYCHSAGRTIRDLSRSIIPSKAKITTLFGDEKFHWKIVVSHVATWSKYFPISYTCQNTSQILILNIPAYIFPIKSWIKNHEF